MRIFPILLLIFTSVTSCGGSASTSSNAGFSVYKQLGSRQCEGGGMPLPAMARQLTDAGIQVLASACSTDGKIYPAVCGAADGRIGIFEIPAEQAQAAFALGFAPLNNLPEAGKLACK